MSLRNDCRFTWVPDAVKRQMRLDIRLPFAIGDALVVHNPLGRAWFLHNSTPTRLVGIFLGIHRPYSDQVVRSCPSYDLDQPKIPIFFVDHGIQMVALRSVLEVIRGSESPSSSSFSVEVNAEYIRASSNPEHNRMWKSFLDAQYRSTK